MIWTPSPRPPWSEWLMNLTLWDATAFMAHLSLSRRPSPSHRVGGAMTSRARPLGLRRFKGYLIGGGQPTEADDQILGAQDGGQSRGTGREGHLAGRMGVGWSAPVARGWWRKPRVANWGKTSELGER